MTSSGFGADERPTPTLLLAVHGNGGDGDAVEQIAEAVDGGADGLLLDAADLTHLQALALVAAVRTRIGHAVHLIAANDPSLAAKAGTGLLLPEAGIATAEARRRLGAVPLLARVVSSPAAAEASAGADLVVAEQVFVGATSGAALGLSGLRAIVERSWAPVLARGGVTPARAAEARSAGASGVIVDAAADAGYNLAATVQAIRDALGPLDAPDASGAQGNVTIELDGAPTLIEEPTTVTDLLGDLGRPLGSVVHVNGRRMPRHAHDETVLRDGDRVEVQR